MDTMLDVLSKSQVNNKISNNSFEGFFKYQCSFSFLFFLKDQYDGRISSIVALIRSHYLVEDQHICWAMGMRKSEKQS